LLHIDSTSVVKRGAIMEEARKSRRSKLWYILLIVPFIGTMFPSLYASATPTLWGFPYFYWYQMAWVIISAIITYVVYRVTKEA